MGTQYYIYARDVMLTPFLNDWRPLYDYVCYRFSCPDKAADALLYLVDNLDVRAYDTRDTVIGPALARQMSSERAVDLWPTLPRISPPSQNDVCAFLYRVPAAHCEPCYRYLIQARGVIVGRYPDYRVFGEFPAVDLGTVLSGTFFALASLSLVG